MASVLVDEVVKKLASIIGQEWDLQESFKDDLESMKSTFTTIRAVLEDAEKRCLEQDSSQLHDWLTKLKDAAEEVANFLVEIETQEAERSKQHQNHRVDMVWFSFFSLLCNCFDLCNPMTLKSNYDMAHKMKSLREKLDKIADERRDFHLSPAVAISDRRKAFHDGRETIALIDESEIVGREEDKENIIKLVLDMDKVNKRNVSVIPIVGIDGIGKTTLTQVVFNDGRVRGEHFDLRVWVCVSDDFSLEAIGRKILSETNEACDDRMSSQAIAKRVVEKLEGKRFLLVLDDVSNDDQDKWDKVKVLFKAGTSGSKILVTTRSETVAEIMGSVPEPYSLQRLLDDDCWALFQRKAFKEGKEIQDPRLEDFGREIVKKCGGVPSAAIALGSKMRHKRTIAEWKAAWDSEIPKLKDDRWRSG